MIGTIQKNTVCVCEHRFKICIPYEHKLYGFRVTWCQSHHGMKIEVSAAKKGVHIGIMVLGMAISVN